MSETRSRSGQADRTWQRPWTLADLVRDPALVHAGDADEAALAALASPTRRGLLKGVGGLFAVSALAACSRAPKEKILPYNRTPPELIPGVPSFYATTLETDGYARGVIAELNDGRPTKIEGNPDHPASLGATLAIEQAAIWQLYDPDRAKETTEASAPASFDRLKELLRARGERNDSGKGLALLFPATSSRVLAAAIDRVRAKLPLLNVHFYSAGSPHASWESAHRVYGAPVETYFDFAGVKTIVAFDADLFGEGPQAIALGRAFADGRRLAGTTEMNRLYVVEPAPTVTGGAADHRQCVRPDEIAAYICALAVELSDQGLLVPPAVLDAAKTIARATVSPESSNAQHRWLEAVARDLLLHRADSAIAVGPAQPAALHALVALLNLALGGRMRARPSPILEAGAASHDLAELTRAMQGGAIDTLIVFGGNPAYASAAEIGFAAAMSKVPNTVYLAPYVDETALLSRWVVPAAHPLEAWRDGAAFDGTWSVAQPVLSPLTEGRTAFDLLAPLAGKAALTSPHDWLQEQVGAGRPWAEALTRGVVKEANLPRTMATASPDLPAIAALLDALVPTPALALAPPAKQDGSLALSLPFDNFVRDGQMTNCPWLLELPHPTDKTTWGNCARIAPSLATARGLADGDVVRLTVEDSDRSIEAVVLSVLGMAADTVSLSLGFGRAANVGETNARHVGSNGFVLASAKRSNLRNSVTLEKTGRREVIARTQEYFVLDAREDEIVPEVSLSDLRKGAFDFAAKRAPAETLYAVRPSVALAKRQWGMTIDLNACTGCQSCVIACQVENNIPTVGKAGIAKGREMHWLRIDRYIADDPGNPAPHTKVQPMLCQHCEKAPCEYVCPVEATSHSSEGLNQMTYNRCVGTRFCSNNCPYKVRRFNWYDYHDDEPDVVRLGRNPDVTVRARGVMEKCTFCVQRIRGAQQKSETEGRDERTDEFTSACAQACPTHAIVFGNIADPKSEVSARWNEPRVFTVLHDLGTDPRVRYATRVRNINPAIERA